MKSLKFKMKVIKSRLMSLRREVLFFDATALFSIFLVDIFLIRFQAFNRTMFYVGQVYIKLCYSYFSAFIFYFLVVHAPRERRRIKSFRFLSNKISVMYRDIYFLFPELFKKPDLKINELTGKEIQDLSKTINPKMPISVKIGGLTISQTI